MRTLLAFIATVSLFNSFAAADTVRVDIHGTIHPQCGIVGAIPNIEFGETDPMAASSQTVNFDISCNSFTTYQVSSENGGMRHVGHADQTFDTDAFTNFIPYNVTMTVDNQTVISNQTMVHDNHIMPLESAKSTTIPYTVKS